MGSKIIDGRKVAELEIKKMESEIKKLKNKGITPGLAVVLVGDDEASKTYVRMKEKRIEKLGMHSEQYSLKSTVSASKLKDLISKLNRKKNIDGILVQLPLPPKFNSLEIICQIDYRKDVDGFHPHNIGLLTMGTPLYIPCTPLGILKLLEHYRINLKGKRVAIIGRSLIVGRPMSILLSLKGRDATVTLCHSRTKDIEKISKNSDIIIAAIGNANFLTGSMVKKGAVIIDVGMNRININGERKLVGDVDFNGLIKKASLITPVPGGVGPMTIAMLMNNLVFSAKKFRITR